MGIATRETSDVTDEASDPKAGSDALFRARVLAAVAAAPAPTRAVGRRNEVTLAVASVALALGMFEWAGGLGHSSSRPLELTLVIAGGWGFITALLSGAVLWRRGSTLGPPPMILVIGSLAIPVALVVWMHLFQGTYVELDTRVGWRCLGLTLAMSALPLASFLGLRRGIEPRGPWALGAAIGASCGASTGVLVDLWCPLTNTRHVLFGHVLPLLLLMVIGTLLGRRMLGVRRISTIGASSPCPSTRS